MKRVSADGQLHATKPRALPDHLQDGAVPPDVQLCGEVWWGPHKYG